MVKNSFSTIFILCDLFRSSTFIEVLCILCLVNVDITANQKKYLLTPYIIWYDQNSNVMK